MAGSGTEDRRERVAVPPDEKKLQKRNDNGHWQAARVHQDVDEIDIHNDGSEQNQTERDETSDKQEQTANDLEHGDDVKIVANEKGLREVSKQTRRRRWHRNEVQEDVRTEDNENESEKNPRDNGGDFHPSTVA
jgi:hypothetical protein